MPEYVFSLDEFFGRVVAPSPKIVINLPRIMRGYIVKENHIGSVVSEILRYTHTHTDPVTLRINNKWGLWTI